MSNTINKIECYKEAYRLMVDGKSVMPVGKDKKPLLKSWKFLQDRLPTEEELKQWWTKYPEANIGLITGKISNITVLDLDVGHEQQTSPDIFPKTLTQSTPSGGIHLIYQYQEGFTVSANQYKDYPYLDIRGDGGFIVYAPSTTPRGSYIITNNITPTPFPSYLFPINKKRKSITEMTTASKGNRDDSLTSLAGKLLQSEANEEKWLTEILPALERINKSYSPPLLLFEVRKIFNSIAKKEKQRRENLILSPIQMEGEEKLSIHLRMSKQGVTYKDMSNVLIVLEEHPYYKGTIRYNEFRQEIEYNGKPIEDSHLINIQRFMQTDAKLHGINKEAVHSAIIHCAYSNKYDEAKDWLKSLKWDQIPRLTTWLSSSLGVEDNEYYQGVGAQWIMGSVRRIMLPGSIFDYVMILVGAQGIGKTSFFRILGGDWYKSYTGQVDNKDFYLALRGATIVDLDEGATLYKSEAIKMKSIITETHDEYRAPYDRMMKKYPRRFVFSTSTNDTEPFRDITGNRRYWTVDFSNKVNFKWLEDNRDQIYAEAYYCFVNKIKIPDVPLIEAKQRQDVHLPDDSWTDLVVEEVEKSAAYCEGDETYSTTILDIFRAIFPQESVARLGRSQEMRIAQILKKHLGLEKKQRMTKGERIVKWTITPEKVIELQANNAVKKPSLDDF